MRRLVARTVAAGLVGGSVRVWGCTQ